MTKALGTARRIGSGLGTTIEHELRRSVEEKEVLLREIHHRVKNNLQVICSLLQLQAADAGAADVAHRLAESERRVRTMALIHEQLYRSDDLARVDFRAYVNRLAKNVRAITGRPVDTVRDDAMRALLAYDWPGNVRELKNALGYAAMHCHGSEIDLEDLPPELLDGVVPAAVAADLPEDERERILAALARTGGERKAAAALLGIGRATLYRKLSQYGLG